MVKDFPYVGFNAPDDTDRSTRDDQVPFALRMQAAGLIERSGTAPWILFKLAGGVAWLLYRAADFLDKRL